MAVAVAANELLANLTPTQEEVLETYKDKWSVIELTKAPCNLEESKKYLRIIYRESSLVFPNEFHVCSGPKEAAEKALSVKIREGVVSAHMTEQTRKAELKKCVSEMMVYNYQRCLKLYEMDFLTNEMKTSYPIWEGLIGIAQNCGAWAPYSNCVILQDRIGISFNGLGFD